MLSIDKKLSLFGNLFSCYITLVLIAQRKNYEGKFIATVCRIVHDKVRLIFPHDRHLDISGHAVIVSYYQHFLHILIVDPFSMQYINL